MFKYLRYLVVVGLLFSLFYSYSVHISYDTINNAIQKKLPIKKDKKGVVVVVNSVKLNRFKGKEIDSEIIGRINMSSKNLIKTNEKVSSAVNKLAKFFKKTKLKEDLENKTFDFDLQSTIAIDLKGDELYFKLISINNPTRLVKKVEPFLKKITYKMKIKQLEKYHWIASVKDFKFSPAGDLTIKIGISKFIIFILIILFLLREIGLLAITFYQKFLSPRKGYSCAKNHVHKNGSCSETTKKAFKEKGFIGGMKEYRKSTKECKKAYSELNNKNENNHLETALCASCDGISIAGAGAGADAGACDCGAGAGDCAAGGCDGIGAC